MQFHNSEERIQAMDLTPTEWAYLAGIIDGEGSIQIVRYPPKPRYKTRIYQLGLYVTNTNRPLMDWIETKLGGYRFHQSKRYAGKGGRHQYWQWKASTRHAMAILKGVRPYLIGKAEQADVGIAFQEHIEEAKHRRYERKIGVTGRPILTDDQIAVRESFYLRLLEIRKQDLIPLSDSQQTD
jgi:hypothetical protein